MNVWNDSMIAKLLTSAVVWECGPNTQIRWERSNDAILPAYEESFRDFYTIIISIQPEGRFWQEPEPSQATGMALEHCILGRLLGVASHCFPPPLDVPTFASRCLHVQAT